MPEKRFNLRVVIEHCLGLPTKAGKWFCPFHNDKNGDFAIVGEKFVCESCGESGDEVDFLHKIAGKSETSKQWVESIRLLEKEGRDIQRGIDMFREGCSLPEALKWLEEQSNGEN